ncbi:dihydrofolate reductase [Patescibacteria group bacterium]|nr:dihydrofolate reductase [Patescibacteria group bacterium]
MSEKKPTISIICAMAESNRAIGKENQLLWHISDDLKNFKRLTSGHPIIMGQKTYESIGKPLPNRTNIVLTKDYKLEIEGCVVAFSIEDAINKAQDVDSEEIFIIGGGQVYQQTIGLADKLYLTLIEGDFEADTFFPDYSLFKKIDESEIQIAGAFKYKFVELIK